jgi:hypothetical protein
MKINGSDPCPCGSGATYGDCHDRLRRERQTRESELLHVALNVVPPPDPGERSIFEMTNASGSVLFAGVSGRHSLDCGNCSTPLATRVNRDQFQAIVLRCNRCGAYNDT